MAALVKALQKRVTSFLNRHEARAKSAAMAFTLP
jgi:hypothetical protein